MNCGGSTNLAATRRGRRRDEGGEAGRDNEEGVMKEIMAQMVSDWVEPYRKGGSFIPQVVTSTHPRFSANTRLDWGFVRVALRDGYRVTILPAEVEP